MITKNRIIVGLIAILIVASLPLWRFVSPSFAEELNIINLPLVMRNYPKPLTVFGGEVYSFTNQAVIDLAVESNVTWLRIPVFDWSEIEPTAPVNGVHSYDWSSVPESSLMNISSNGMVAIATVQMTPSWAQKYAGVACGPVAEAHFSDFAAFLMAAVQRYGNAPYNIHYWELGNEPDVDPGLVPPDSGYGCWGDKDDYYYGGGYYASMLKVAYPAIKSIDPQAKVLIGGLLLHCDPSDPDCEDLQPSKFFGGILRNGGGNYFDIVSYHGYAFYSDGLIYDDNAPTWDQLGGVVLGKAAFLRDVMARYGIDKPLLLTEGALLCDENNTQDCNPPGEDYEDAKADYVVWLFTRAIAHNLEGSIWYTFDGSGWRGSGIIGSTNNPNPAYYALKFLSKELLGAEYTGRPPGVDSDLRAYSFRTQEKMVWVVWSGDGKAHRLSLPAGYIHIYDKLGNSISVAGGEMLVNSPIYIELP